MNPSSQRTSRGGRDNSRVSSRKNGQSSSIQRPVELRETNPQEPQDVANEVYTESHAVLASGNGSTEDEVQFIEESLAPAEPSATDEVVVICETKKRRQSDVQIVDWKRGRKSGSPSPRKHKVRNAVAKSKKELKSKPKQTARSPRPECPVCLDLLNSPTATPCGHLFCNQCIIKSLTQSKQCPSCRKNVDHRKLVRIYF